MPTPRLPLPLRVVVGAGAALLVVAGIGATTAVRYGADALDVGGGFVVSAAARDQDVWIGFPLDNRRAVPVTLRAVELRSASNVRVVDARVIEPREDLLLMLSRPLPPDLRDAIDAGRPVEGFVVPPRSHERYELAVRLRHSPDAAAVVRRTAITYSVLGVDQGVLADGVFRIRAPRAG